MLSDCLFLDADFFWGMRIFWGEDADFFWGGRGLDGWDGFLRIFFSLNIKREDAKIFFMVEIWLAWRSF